MVKKLLFCLAIVILLLTSCGQEESTPTPQMPTITPLVDAPVTDSDGGITIQWTQGEAEDKLYLDSGEDVDTEEVTVGSPALEARRLGNCQILSAPDGNKVHDCSMQFRIDDSIIFAGSPTTMVLLEIEYFDQGTDSFFIQYDALDGAPFGNGKLNEVYFSKTDTRVFKTATFTLEDANFANRLHGSDFRIDGMDDGAEIIRRVKITLLETPSEQTADTEGTVDTADTADIIFYNGVILTIETSQPQAQAVAIQGNQILAVGSNSDIMDMKGPETRLIDLAGLTMMPGFIEGHNHYIQNSGYDGISIDEMMSNLVRFGLTSEAEMHGDRDFIEFMLAAEKNNEVVVRVSIFAQYNYSYLVDGKTVIDPAWYLDNAPILDPSRKVRIPGVKIFMDGAGGVPGRGCSFRSFPFPSTIADVWPEHGEFCGTPYGDLYLDEEQLTNALQTIQDRGYRASFHVMGDASAAITLDAIESVLDGRSNSIYRHQIQHNSLLSPELVQRYVKLDILAALPGGFNTCDADWYISALGEEYYEWTVNRFSLADQGAHVYAVGDWIGGDVNKLNPFLRLYGLVTLQQHVSGVCESPEWIAKHKISVERALEMLTIEAAYAVSMEDYIGSIQPGKFADLLIISDNPLTITDPDQLKDLQVWMTMIDGKVEYCMPGHEDVCP